MRRRVLAAGEQLWAQDDPATSMAVVERGRLAVRSGGVVLGVLFERMVLGESAILSLNGAPVRRSATVSALERGAEVTEYDAALVKETFGAGVPQMVLRTLCGQICRNALLTIVAHPSQPSVESSLLGLVKAVAECERGSREVKSWDAFLVSFRMLYHLREGSDAMRDDLLPGGEVGDTVVRASEKMRSVFKAPDVVAYLEEFLESERARLAAR